jgi:signal transduction histidine kinase
MVSVFEKLYTLVALSVPNIDVTIDVDQLGPMGYVVHQANSAEAVQQLLNTDQIDAMICDDSPEALQLVTDIHNQYINASRRPITCVITDHDSLPIIPNTVDIVLPPIPITFLERQLRSHLSFRQNRIKIQLEQSEIDLLKNAIVRNVSHELKTPLLQVKSAVALIAEDDADERLSQMAVQATARLETVVKNITLLADSMNGNFGPMLAHESLDQAIRNLRRIWIHKNATSRIERHIDDNIPPVLGDQQGLGIVLQQLLDNALKFSEDIVRVEIKNSGEAVYIAVVDTGIGIEPDKIKAIFESFYQIDSSPTRRYGGTGVGLAIVRLIMDKHNVDIKVTSTPGKGSTFAFTLPTAPLH